MENNYYDNLKLDIDKFKSKVLASDKHKLLRPVFPKISMILNGAIHVLKISKEFVYSFLLTSWFKNFKCFWQEILNGRPIDIMDFHLLRFSYRGRFQSAKHFNESNNSDFLKAWQSDENISQLFNATWRYAKSAYLDFLRFYFQLPRKGKVLEYGCAVAPFTTGILKYFPSKKYDFEIVDILQINFLYAIYNLSNLPNVKYRILEPYNNLVDKDNYYSAIICQTVLEHVPNPLKVVKSFYSGLKEGGVLVFDYIKTNIERIGLDSRQSLDEREEVLKFIKNNFQLIKGKIDFGKSVGLCVVKKIKK
ncbi:class I SAM-dependent methyltransferase [Patescibacteria group bacterium]|nr:class I SAM-dependent methyltransferase [Patescibacteria group bacterium]